MEPLTSFTDHHPGVCYLQYETDRLSYITTEDAKFQYCKAPTHWKFPVVITSNVAAVSDSKIEPDGAYSQDYFNILVKVPSPL